MYGVALNFAKLATVPAHMASTRTFSESAHKHARALTEKFSSRTAVVAVVGMGYVGLPLAKAMHDAGHTVIGFDVDPEKVQRLTRGVSYLKHLGERLVPDLASSSRFSASCNISDLVRADVIVLCVPTPLGNHHEPDLSYVESSSAAVASILRPGQLVSLESTSYPGTTREVTLSALEEISGLRAGEDFFLVFSPEREDPGRKDYTTQTTPRLVGGVDTLSTAVGVEFYLTAVKTVVPTSSAEVAEAAKLLENIYRSVNIALVNELKPVLADMGIDIWEVIRAASSKPFGFQAFYPGPGLGGHCIPIDPYYLTYKAREFGHVTRFIELAGEINHQMPGYVVQRTMLALNQECKSMRGSRVLVLGIAYKPDVDDIRETPAAEVISMLIEHGADVSYHDPHVAAFPAMRKYDITLQSVAMSAEVLAAADAVVIITDHKAIDWALVAAHARVIVDTRDAIASRALKAVGTVVKA